MKLRLVFSKFQEDMERIIGEEVVQFFADLQQQSPVDTGTFKGAWVIKKTGSLEWEISNAMMYASVLWDGRRIVGEVARGSEQWPQGGEPMLLAVNRKISDRLNRLKM